MRIETELTSGGVALIRLASPETANALGPRDIARLTEEVVRFQADGSGVRCLVLTGSGGTFSAGGDLNALRDYDAAALETKLRDLTLGFGQALELGRLPSIAAVNGPAAGGAVGIALAFDIVVAAPSARFMFPFARLGLVPDSGLTYRLPRMIGEARARAVSLLARNLTAAEAQRYGLIYKVAASDATLMDEVQELAARLASMPVQGHRRIRESLIAARTHTLDEQVALECRLQASAAASDEFKAAVAALLDRR